MSEHIGDGAPQVGVPQVGVHSVILWIAFPRRGPVRAAQVLKVEADPPVAQHPENRLAIVGLPPLVVSARPQLDVKRE